MQRAAFSYDTLRTSPRRKSCLVYFMVLLPEYYCAIFCRCYPSALIPSRLGKKLGAHMSDNQPPLEYLLKCSQISLDSYELSRLNKASNLRHEFLTIAEEWIREEVCV